MKFKVLIIFIIVLFGSFLVFLLNKNYNNDIKNDEILIEKVNLSEVKSKFSNIVKVKDGGFIYVKSENGYEVNSTISGEIVINLDDSYEIVDEYFKVLDSDFYVKYNDVELATVVKPMEGEFKYYKNYIVYNKTVILDNSASLYVDNSKNNYYVVSGGSFPVIILDDDKYGIEYNNSLVYVSKDDVVEIIDSNNTDSSYADKVAVLNYHYTVSANNDNGELDECKQIICGTDKQLDSHMDYLKKNDYYAVSMRDLELFIDGKIQLPKKSVSLTFDDGWYMTRAVNILEKYEMLGTLFLIGNLASPDSYKSKYLEIHSHTWDMHGLETGDDCPSSNYRGGITCFDDKVILNDLKKSRESLNNTTYFCYPFYDYTDRAIKLLKEAGFTMAFAGQTGKSVKVGQDKFKIPRYVMYNYTTLDNLISYVS